MTQKMVARSLNDILAAIPVTFGFHPEDSVVMLANGADKSGFQARVDLELTSEGRFGLANCLVEAAIQNDRNQLVLLFYTEDAELAEAHARACLEVSESMGLQVLCAVRVDDERYYPLRTIDPVLALREPQGWPYDNAEHPFTLQAQYEGQVIHASRAERAALLTTFDSTAARKLRRALRDLRVSREHGSLGLAEQGRWLQQTLRDTIKCNGRLGITDAARVIDLVSQIQFRDVAWLEIRQREQAWLDLWLDLTQRSSLLEDADRVAPAALLAFASWQVGDGALAWCAVEHCLSLDLEYHLAHLVADALVKAIPPGTWSPPDESLLTVFTDPCFANPSDASAS
ncbi:MAG TPA: DUF4192 domain-containing protein [Marmoricola sp.]|nr:DUF4192 domain-containing protein [Marmoricola sp.]